MTISSSWQIPALMNRNNVALLQKAGYRYIIGARLKNEDKDVKQWILSLDRKDDVYNEIKRQNGERLIVSYSEKRAKKDAYNRISRDIDVAISEEKNAEDSKWDGLKGYITNTDIDGGQVITQYHGLWVVERAFRISKGTLEMRPMFHFTEKRIEAHICICFIAYKVYKELERLIAINNIGMSVDKVLDAAKTVTTIRIRMPEKRHILYENPVPNKNAPCHQASFQTNNRRFLIWVTH